MSHTHKCMSCGESWQCPHPPSDCKANESVLPSLVLRGPNGPQMFDHICQRKRTVSEKEQTVLVVDDGIAPGRLAAMLAAERSVAPSAGGKTFAPHEPDCALADRIEKEVQQVAALKEDRGDPEYWLLQTFVANADKICAALRAPRSATEAMIPVASLKAIKEALEYAMPGRRGQSDEKMNYEAWVAADNAIDNAKAEIARILGDVDASVGPTADNGAGHNTAKDAS